MRSLLLPCVRPTAGLGLAALAVLVFTALALDLRWHGPLTRADIGVSVRLHGGMHPLLTQFMVAVTDLHSTLGICVLGAIAAAGLVSRRAFHWLPLLVAVVPGGLVLNASLKHVFARARPLFDGLPVSDLRTFSFPSGHTAGATIWWGFALVLWFAFERRALQRLAGVSVAVALVLLTGLSRVYLGFHFPSDVLAAMAEGVAWLALCVTLVPRLQGAPARQHHAA